MLNTQQHVEQKVDGQHQGPVPVHMACGNVVGSPCVNTDIHIHVHLAWPWLVDFLNN
jgi:hypothetical protein